MNLEPPSGIVWSPTDEYVRMSRLKRFMDRHGISEYDELLRRATEDVAWFWDAVCQDLELEWYRPYEQVLDTSRGVDTCLSSALWT
jgi:acetyl-CoA synthetase